MKIFIGMDPEFMARYKNSYIFPILAEKNENLPKGKTRDRIINALQQVSYDEFGHCVEIRPKQAETGRKLILNVAENMMSLPKEFVYFAPNVIYVDRSLVTKMIRAAGRKDISNSKNIYGKDVLNSCKAEVEALKQNKSLLFCGCHMHISATDTVTVNTGTETHAGQTNVSLPAKALTWLFDNLIFDSLVHDPCFNIGRYRDRGFYEPKSHGGFEYRSLGASTLTPRRIELIADIMIKITKEFVKDNDNFFMMPEKEVLCYFNKIVAEHLVELKRTKPISGNIRKNWSL